MDVTRAGKGEPGLQNPAGPTDKPNLHALESMLPKAVKRRVHALKRLQLQCVNIESKFYEEVHELERKYAAICRPLYDKRRDIVTAAVEPTDAECEWNSDKDEEDELSDQIKKIIAIDTKMEDSPSVEDPKGIPDFWLTIFRNADMLTDMIQEHDEPILKHLKDIQVKFSEPNHPMSFTLEFYFEPNSFFSNTVLTKVYKMKAEPDTSEPFSFEGPEIVDCVGCTIDWHKGKDVTVKTIRKKQKHKGRGTVRTVTKQVPNPSFFNFFNPVKASPDGAELDEDSELTFDFEVGHFFRERIIPRAVLYFTGEAMEDDESFDEELEEGDEEQDDDDDDDEDDDDDDDDDDGDFDPRKETPAQPAECKQQ
ncbi:nucleosome assembly protein 1-like 4a isoform X2 [Corythoichthys intestinalis]|uniref:nucleosome assembly protein 1-like 4a isoform X2 n=1 Tax=Corythoichthys intestinalis TaxID=161448 RepID=UPI0025A4E04E|nr:nucleosome assembly protein 1-like 4a isoform X2 [Corythoichthys intestinalis]